MQVRFNGVSHFAMDKTTGQIWAGGEVDTTLCGLPIPQDAELTLTGSVDQMTCDECSRVASKEFQSRMQACENAESHLPGVVGALGATGFGQFTELETYRIVLDYIQMPKDLFITKYLHGSPHADSYVFIVSVLRHAIGRAERGYPPRIWKLAWPLAVTVLAPNRQIAAELLLADTDYLRNARYQGNITPAALTEYLQTTDDWEQVELLNPRIVMVAKAEGGFA